MIFELWVIIWISLGAGLASTPLTSPLLWYNLRTRGTIWADKEHNGITGFSSKLMFFIVNLGLAVIYAFCIFAGYIASIKFSLFCMGTLVAIFVFTASKVVLHQLIFYKKANKKIIAILVSLFAIYFLFFIYDNFLFSKVNLEEKMDEVELSEEILPDTIHTSSIKRAYQTNGKTILEIDENSFFIIDGENHVTFYDNPSFLRIGDNIPIQLMFKNPKKLSIGISNDNTIYFIYALLSQKSLLGEYEVTEYALYDPIQEKFFYSDVPPHFLN